MGELAHAGRLVPPVRRDVDERGRGAGEHEVEARALRAQQVAHAYQTLARARHVHVRLDPRRGAKLGARGVAHLAHDLRVALQARHVALYQDGLAVAKHVVHGERCTLHVFQHFLRTSERRGVEHLLVSELAVDVDHLAVAERARGKAGGVAREHPAHGQGHAARDGAHVQARVDHGMDGRDGAVRRTRCANGNERVVQIGQGQLDHVLLQSLADVCAMRMGQRVGPAVRSGRGPTSPAGPPPATRASAGGRLRGGRPRSSPSTPCRTSGQTCSRSRGSGRPTRSPGGCGTPRSRV